MRVEHIGNATLYLGDALDVVGDLGSVDAFIMDPPYSSGARTSAEVRGRGGMSRGVLWKSQPLTNDRMTVTGFVWLMRQIGLRAADTLVDGGSLLSFIDWRQYPTLYGVLESCNLRIQTLVVWDKEDMALGNGFRNQHELIVHAAKDTPNVFDRSTPNVLRHKRISSSELHPTEKPIGLFEMLVQVVTDVGGIVVDPFMGSGACGAACLRHGRRFIGVEIELRYFDIACRRIEQAQRQPDLFIRPASDAAYDRDMADLFAPLAAD